jgi:hypothetical protein
VVERWKKLLFAGYDEAAAQKGVSSVGQSMRVPKIGQCFSEKVHGVVVEMFFGRWKVERGLS